MPLKIDIARIFRSKTTSILGVMVSVSMVSSVVMALSGLVIARWVSPEVMGIARKFTIPAGYAAVLLILVSDGFRREYPYLIGKGDTEEAFALAGVAKAWYFICTLVMCCFFAVLTLRSFVAKNWVDVAGWGAQIIAVTMAFYGSYLATIYRRSLEFKQLSYNGLTATIAGIISLPCVKFFGYYGLILRQSIINIVGLWMNQRYLPVRAKMLWDKKRFCRLVKISVPLASVGYVRTSLLDSTFNYIVLATCGEASLGLYGIAVTFQSFALQFVNAVSQVFHVKVANKYGECESVGKSLKYLAYPTMLAVIASMFIAVCLCISIGPFIRILLPKYVDAIPVIWILSINLPLMALGLPSGILNVALKYKAMMSSAIIRVASVVILLLIVPHTIEWCAASSIIGHFIGLAVEWLFLFRLTR